MRRLLIGLSVVLAGCPTIAPPPPSALSSFVFAEPVFFLGRGAGRTPLSVVTSCADKHGSQALVPAAEKGTKECPYAIARGEIEIDVVATARDAKGQPALTFEGPVSFRVVPGDLTGGYEYRSGTAVKGVVTATIRTAHQYGGVRIWAEDAPPQPIFADGGLTPGADGGLPVEPARRTYATGLSRVVHFEEPTIAKVQIPDGFDNRSSPLVGEFITIGKNPESGERLLQTCVADPQRNGQPALMVVTGTDPSGFFVTDISACRMPEPGIGTSDGPRTPEPKVCLATLVDGGVVSIEDAVDGGLPRTSDPARCQIGNEPCTASSACVSYLPSTFGHMFIYNYSFPEGLDEGDLLWTLSGSVQEFTSTTQLTFPAWTIAEKVRRLPPDQWNKWLQYAPPVEVHNRLCGSENVFAPFLTDQLCGHNRRNLKMESNESGLVVVRRVKMPTDFASCDFNNDLQVPFFCETRTTDWVWASCSFPPSPPEPPAETEERLCNQECVIGANEWKGKVCSERTTYVGFGQYVVEMNPPGAAEFGFDESVPNRVQRFAVSATAARPAQSYAAGTDTNMGCDVDVAYAFGPAGTVATAASQTLKAGEVLHHVFTGTEAIVSIVVPAAGVTGRCWIAQNFHNRINVITKDAVPELAPDCRLDDLDAEKANQCKLTRAATFDIVGHLRHLQPGRPRWAVVPRDTDDVCCHPGPGLDCPKPIKPCP